MKTDQIIDQLECNRIIFQALLTDRTPDEYNFQLDKNSWTLLEILCHLLDEEREDFRTRVKNTLTTPKKQPPSIDPPGWVTSRNYAAAVYIVIRKFFLHSLLQLPEWKLR